MVDYGELNFFSITRKFFESDNSQMVMNWLHVFSYCLVAVSLVLLPASAIETADWKNQTINDEFVVLLPTDWSTFAMSSHAGPATAAMDNNDINNVIAIQVFPNTNCSAVMEENLEVNLGSFNAKAGIADLTSPVYGENNVTMFGKYNDGKFSHLFLKLAEGNVIAAFGSYETMEDAKEKADEFILIAQSITPLHAVVNEICEAEKQKPAPVQTYNPRPVPTVSNTIAPTKTPSQ